MTRHLKCRIDPEQKPYKCMLPEHNRCGAEMIDLLAVEKPKPKLVTGGVVRGSDRPVVQTHAVV